MSGDTTVDTMVLIGVDGGGSGCRAVLRGPDGARGQATAGPANVTTDPVGAIGNVAAAIRGALRDAGLGDAAFDSARVHLGLAGVLDADQATAVATALSQQVPVRHCTVSDDRTTHALGALGGRNGFVVAVGTGSTVARVVDGQVSGSGGWGLGLGDEASGAWLGRGVLARCLHTVDGLVAQSDLLQGLLERFGGPAGVVRFATGAGPSDFAALAPLVDGAAATDPHARILMQEGGAYLDRALRALGFCDGDRLCLTGGLGPQYAGWLQSARTADMAPPEGDALDGALFLARRTGGPDR